MNKKSTLVVCSGGLDSVTLAYDLAAKGELFALVSFDYGQLHGKEITFAKRCAERFGVTHHVLDISTIGQHLRSSLIATSNEEIPEGHYSAENMSSTVVPNRNVIMLSVAFGLAASIGANSVGIAVHGGDHFIYPDCRPEFIEAYARMQNYALKDIATISLDAPYLNFSKGQIAKRGVTLNVPFSETWSCYKGDEVHCGRCGTCVERLEALHFAGADDETIYADETYWRQVVAEHHQDQLG